MIRSLIRLLAAVSLLLMLPTAAHAFCSGCGAACIVPGINPNHFWQVAPAGCYPGINDYHYPRWCLKTGRCYSTDAFFSGEALAPDGLDHWYGNTYDGGF